MTGTKKGAIKARDVQLARDPEHYVKIGAMGGKVRNPNKGYGSNRELARKSSLKGHLTKSYQRKANNA